ncbi:hypothetical protein B0T22DRAFT_443728 [Podospora appendiculata]|uniref:Uncharacterized protein n=1 Tax=Podospora appendiculata TaxID=314037 RepID=A0AAE0X2V7_9PEZI|nr:hypothetical protein B0T22DRAFT_443728 [Podospora appendiculata]
MEPNTTTATTTAIKPASKDSKWNDAAHVALLGAVVDALFEAGSSPAKNKDMIMKTMAAQGLDFTWEAIRWEDIRDDLFEAIMSVHAPLSRDQQDEVVEFMRGRGHNMVWNAISKRLPFSLAAALLSFPSFPFPHQINPQPRRHYLHCSRHHTTLTSITVFIMSKPQQITTWDAEANEDVLIALNKLFLPNAKDCQKMIETMPATGRVLQTWGAETHEAIMFVMIEHLRPSAKQWREMVQILNDRGHTFTEGALQQHLQKLRRKEGANSPKPAGAKKAAAGVKKSGTGTPRKRKGKAAPVTDDNVDNVDDEEGDDFEETPSKKAKHEPPIKDEDDELDDDTDTWGL